jgi:RNA polymerase sigma-70 factor (ECF subfamily)
MLTTSLSLLQRACALDPAAWERLCTLYGPIVYGWCRRYGLQHDDAADCCQEVFQSVFRNLSQFWQNGGVFHSWLGTITLNQVRLHYRKIKPTPGLIEGQQLQDWPGAIPDSDSDVVNTRQQVIRRALDLVRGDFNEQTWQIFERTTLQNETCAEVATALGLTPNAVRQARFRVIRRLRQELDGLV